MRTSLRHPTRPHEDFAGGEDAARASRTPARPTTSAVACDRRTALVTGATSGIGRELATLLAESGHDLVLVARDPHALGTLAAELEKAHGALCEVQAADLSSRQGIEAIRRRIDLGADIDVLVNSAGAGWYGNFIDQDAEEAASLVELDVTAVTTLCRAASGPMAARRRGGILNVSSIAAFAPGPSCAIYHAAKAYVMSFTEALHEELRPYGIHVTALCPGMTPTGFQARAGARRDSLPRWVWSDPRRVAAKALERLDHDDAIYVPGLLNRALTAGTRLTPRWIVRRGSGAVIEHLLRAPCA